jgi:hypothetical protein
LVPAKLAPVKIICENKPVSLKQLHSFFNLNNASIFPFYGVLFKHSRACLVIF